MFSTLGTILLVVLLPVGFIVTMIVVVARRGFQMNQLLEDGVETVGTIIGKQTHPRNLKTYHLRYRYTDQRGVQHSHRSMVEPSVYHAHEQDGTIPVVYSESKPSVSAPKYLLEQVREGKRKQKEKRAR